MVSLYTPPKICIFFYIIRGEGRISLGKGWFYEEFTLSMDDGISVQTDDYIEWRSGESREGRWQSVRRFVLGSVIQYPSLDFDSGVGEDVAVDVRVKDLIGIKGRQM
ncbi:hypothetical protein [Rossellomorea sp. NPDC077527]|uniref:hypothetical protein n=1 Tax=Rossellomorea sp. NPDC077527 TaxID=3364510 RepID=UPI0037C668EF